MDKTKILLAILDKLETANNDNRFSFENLFREVMNKEDIVNMELKEVNPEDFIDRD